MALEFYKLDASADEAKIKVFVENSIPELTVVTQTITTWKLTINGKSCTTADPSSDSTSGDNGCMWLIFVDRDAEGTIKFATLLNSGRIGSTKVLAARNVFFMYGYDTNNTLQMFAPTTGSSDYFYSVFNSVNTEYLDNYPTELHLARACYKNTIVLRDVYIGVGHGSLPNVRYSDGTNTFVGLTKGLFYKLS